MILNCELIIGSTQERARESAADSKILSIATDRYRVVGYAQSARQRGSEAALRASEPFVRAT